MASSVTVPRYFRFCPQCLEVDLQEHGEIYWHQLHQIPGVLVCPVHAVILEDSRVPIQGFNKHEYQAASLENCPVTCNQKTYSSNTLKKLLLLAQDVCWLMNSNLSAREPEWFRKRYVALLIEQGLATATGRVHHKQLLDHFLVFYGREMLEAVDSFIDHEKQYNWAFIFNIVRKPRIAFHPIRHLLMIRFLAGSIEEFFKNDYQYKPFGAPPWICLNAASDHYLQPVVTELVISQCYDTKKPVGTFQCSCGFIYCRTGPDKTQEDKHRIGKVKAYGFIWEQELRQLVEIEQLGLRATARQLKVDPHTVKRYALQLKLKTSWQSSQENEPEEFQEQLGSDVYTANALKMNREKWLALQQEYPAASKTTLRKMTPAIYAWLYKNDREWLNQNSPILKVPVASSGRVDWPQRDRQVLDQVKDAVELLLKAEAPIRVTNSRIAKTLDIQTLIEKHLDKMPLTKVYLESVTEQIEDYQIRRVKWAIAKLEEQGEEVKTWKVIKMAGLGGDYSEKVQVALESELDRCPIFNIGAL